MRGQRLGFSKPKVPERNKELEKKQMALLEAQLKQAKTPFEMPSIAVPKPAPPPPPAPTSSSADVQEAATDARRQSYNRQGIQSTILAGETGGYKSQALGGNPSILG
jgi:hypothetical protein